MPSEPSPQLAAFIRSLYGALLLGASAFFSIWATTDDPKIIAIATGTSILGYLILRNGEGAIDQRNKPLMNQPPASDLDTKAEVKAAGNNPNLGG